MFFRSSMQPAGRSGPFSRFCGQLTRAGLPAILFMLALAIPAMAQTSFNFRAVHLVEGSGPLDVHFENREVASISALAYGTVSSQLKNLPAVDDMFNVKFAPSGAGPSGAIVGTDVTATSNREYVGIAYGTSGSPEIRVLERNRASFPPTGKTNVRLFNAASILEGIDLYIDEVGASPVIANVPPDSASRFVAVDNTSSTLLLTVAGAKVPIRRVSAPFGQANPFMTVIVTGTSVDNLQVWVLNISTPPEENGTLVLLDEASYTDVRVVNLRPGGADPEGKLDVYMNRADQSDQKVADTLHYREATRNLGPLIADSLRVKFVTAGDPSSQSIFSLTRRFENDTAYVVVLTQFTDKRPTSIVLTRSPVTPLPPGLGTSFVRLVNATDFHGPLSAEIMGGSDLVSVPELEFRESSEFEEIASGGDFHVRLYRPGTAAPIYDRPFQGGKIPAGAYLTLFAIGPNADSLSVDVLNESQPGRQPLVSFDEPEAGGVPLLAGRTLSLSVSPNPLSGSGRVSITSERAGRAEFVIVDMIGRVVATFDPVWVEAGQTSLVLPLDPIESGAYTLVARVGGEAAGGVGIVVVR